MPAATEKKIPIEWTNKRLPNRLSANLFTFFFSLTSKSTNHFQYHWRFSFRSNFKIELSTVLKFITVFVSVCLILRFSFIHFFSRFYFMNSLSMREIFFSFAI